MMSDEIKNLFTLFSGEEYKSDFDSMLYIAVDEVKAMLLPDANENDGRLDFLCAALMNYRYRLAVSSADRSTYTYGGKMLNGSDEKQVDLSERLLREYLGLCRDIIKNTDFVFMSVS